MPELPEVEIMTRNVRRWVCGATLLDVDIRDEKLGTDVAVVRGQRLNAVERRAKYLLMDFGTHVLAWHFRMSGSFVRGQDDRRARALLAFDNGELLRFLDPRRFGTVECVSADALGGWEAAHGLGPEPWPMRRDGAWWRERLVAARLPLKVAMMEPARLVGIGNIAASEILWRARVSPFVRPVELSASDWDGVAEAAHSFLSETVERDAGEEIHYVNAGGPNPFRVYGHEGAACERCGEAIARAVLRGRSTFWCAGCQPGVPP